MDARTFFSGLEANLNRDLPPRSEVHAEVLARAASEKNVTLDQFLSQKKKFVEGPFLSRFVVPVIHEFLQTTCGLSMEDARNALVSERPCDRAEGLANPDLLTKHPESHAFSKQLGSTSNIAASWMAGKLATKHPDLCIRAPIPTLIEGKYFIEHASDERALKVLVEDIYQAFFYRGLVKSRTWNYNHACLLAYDGSPNRSLVRAWKNIPSQVRDSFWRAANIHVLVIDGRND